MVTHGVAVNVAESVVLPGLISGTTIVCAGVCSGTLAANKMALLEPGTFKDVVGDESQMGKAYRAVFNQSRAQFVAINVSNDVAGGQKGIELMADVEEELSTETLSVRPDLLVPLRRREAAVATDLSDMADELLAYGVSEVTYGTAAEAVAWNTASGGKRIIAVVPTVNTLGMTGVSGAAFLAGAIARNDVLRGRYASPSNILVPGVTYPAGTPALGQPYQSTSANSAKLDAANVHSFIRRDGFTYTWGGTTKYDPATDARRFIGVGRQFDEIIQRFVRLALDFQGRGVASQVLTRFLNGGNNILSTMQSAGAILNGQVRALPGDNSLTDLKNGKVTINLEYTPVYPIRLLSYNVSLSDTGLLEVIGG